MSLSGVDLDKLATHLKNKMEKDGLSLRSAAEQMGLGAATLLRLLQGTENANTPDLASMNKATSWVGRGLSDFSRTYGTRKKTTLADVEVQLRALPDLEPQDVEALVAMVKASYEHAKKIRSKKSA
jgi:transcriptional regulator with XRE-family HTH domain